MKKLKLYLLKRTDRINFDEFDSFLVATDKDLEDVKYIHPDGEVYQYNKEKLYWYDYLYYEQEKREDIDYTWTNDLNNIEVIYIGEADHDIKSGSILLTSFRAG